MKQNAFSTLQVVNWNLRNVFHFIKLEKLQVFFLKPDLIPKLDLLKPNSLLSTRVTIMVTMHIVGKGESNTEWPKHVGKHHYWGNFFCAWVFFLKHSRFTAQQGQAEAISLPLLYRFHLLHGNCNIFLVKFLKRWVWDVVIICFSAAWNIH